MTIRVKSLLASEGVLLTLWIIEIINAGKRQSKHDLLIFALRAGQAFSRLFFFYFLSTEHLIPHSVPVAPV